MKNNVTTIVISVLIGAVAFFAGMKYQESNSKTNNNQLAERNRNQGGQRQGRFNGNGGASVGEIIGQDANSITIKLQDGSSKIVIVSDKTTYSKTDTAAKSDLKTGLRVAAFGTANSDGSITAQNIQVNPMFRQGGITGTQPKPTP